MADQTELFPGVADVPSRQPGYPEGFRYQPALLSEAEATALVARVRELPFKDFQFHGYTGKRRVVSFGWKYDFEASRLFKGNDTPDFLLDVREKAAAFAGLQPTELQQVLVTEYGSGAAIGWHKDKAVFGEVVGVSLVSACTFRLRRRVGGTWERVNLTAEPRSAYLLAGPSRTEWEHSIPPVKELRYSLTFRNLREG